MGFLRRILGQRGERRPPTPADLLDALQDQREAAEAHFGRKYPTCPECDGEEVRIGTWARGGQAGLTVTCATCGRVHEQTTEIG